MSATRPWSSISPVHASGHSRDVRRHARLAIVALLLAWPAAGIATERGAAAADPPRRVLRVAADPNNLPFSNRWGEGFENKLAQLLARDLDADLEYEWRAQRRGFFRIAVKENRCDLVLGVPAGFERTLTTAPYYRSSYVFVWRHDRALAIRTLDDPRLRTLRIAVPLVGDDGAEPPPAMALAARGIVDNVQGYTLYGDYAQDDPPTRIVKAVASGEADLAIVWGPLAGWVARRSRVALDVVPLPPEQASATLPFAFDIAVGVRRGEEALRDEVDAVLVRRRAEIERLLDDYGVPRVAPLAKAER